jgi:ribonuclease HI
MKDVISVNLIGHCLPKGFPKIACYAYIIRNKSGILLHESCGLAAEPNTQLSTNTIANYVALIRALEWLNYHDHTSDIITVRTASKVIISHLNKSFDYACDRINKSKSISPFYKKAMNLASKFYKISFELAGINADDSIAVDMDTKEIEELAILAYLEAKEKILYRNSKGKGYVPFIPASYLISSDKTRKPNHS